MRPTHLALLLPAILLLSNASFAQVATGFPPFGSLGGVSFDIVNNANLNASFSIPIVSKAGRGLPFNAALVYNSSVWVPGSAWSPTSTSNWGWTVYPTGAGNISYWSTPNNCMAGGLWYSWNVWSNFTYTDAAGTVHPFNITISNWSLKAMPSGSPAPPASGSGLATDASGYNLSVQATVLYGPQINSFTNRSGMSIGAGVLGGPGTGTVTDPNGNQLTTDNNGHFYDTLGMTTLTVSGSPPNPVSYTYYNSSGEQVSVVVKYTTKAVRSNFGCAGITEYQPANVPLVTGIDLPDDTNYAFTYEPTPGYPAYVTGRLASVTLPTGGTISYTYLGGSNGITCSDGSTATLRRYTPDTGSNYWQYAHTENGSAWTTTITDPQSNQTVLNFQGIYETQRRIYQGASTLLETVDTCYNGASIPCTGTAITLPITNRTTQVTFPGLSPSKTYTTYNSYGLPTETDDYNYGPTLVRKTLITYNTSLYSSNIYDRPSDIQVKDSGNNVKAHSTYRYDSHGNLTGETRYTGGTPSTVGRSFTPGSYGVLTSATDFNNNSTGFSSFTCGSGNTAFPQTITLPLSLSRTINWNCNVALPNSTTDENSRTTSYSYDDLLRLTNVSYPDGGSSSTTYTSATVRDIYTALTGSTSRQDQISLDGLGRAVTNSLVSDPDGQTYVATSYDSLGRIASVTNPYRGSSSGGDTYTYDALNRGISLTHADSNTAYTYYGAAVGSNGGRTTQICSTATYGLGYPTLFKDEANKLRQIWTDGLGRVIEVDEPDPSTGSLTAAGAYNTCYLYDVLGNLTGVAQGSQMRSYAYDMLSRLTQAATPEGGTVHYCYTSLSGPCATPDTGTLLCSGDPSAVCRRTDARGITATYAYDALNRLTGKTYSDSTPPATFSYDQTSVTIGSWSSGTLTNPKGRLTKAVTTSGGNVQTAVVYSYDPMGRVKDHWQCTPYNCGSASIWHTPYNYDLAGDITSWTHPAGFTITNQFSAAQRISQITSSWNDSTHPGTLAFGPGPNSGIKYTPWGAIDTLINGTVSGGTQRQETYTYNNRMQPAMIRLGQYQGNLSANYCLVYNYYGGSNPTSCAAPSQSTSGNNANVTGYWYQDNTNPSLSHSASYTYDALHRLTSSIATGSSTHNLDFSYDQYGNMRCVLDGQTSGPCPQWTFNTSTNRITTSGFQYDAAGNLLNDATYTYTWDGEGRVRTVTGGGLNEANIYNALGQRAEFSTNVPFSYTSEQAFDPSGQFLGQYNSTGGYWWEQDIRVQGRILAYNLGTDRTVFLHKDALGSSHMAMGPAGNWLQDQIFYPWGQGWTSLGTWQEQGFAGFDYVNTDTWQYSTQFRNYHPGLGRWLSPDALAGDISNPQSLNRYAYVLNNPTTLTDPLGLVTPGPELLWSWWTNPFFQEYGCGFFGLCQSSGTDNAWWSPRSPGGSNGTQPATEPPSKPPLGRVIRDFNRCAANIADKYSVASLLHLQDNKVANFFLGSQSAAVSRLFFEPAAQVYVPEGGSLAAGAVVGPALTWGVNKASGAVVNQGFQSLFTTVAPTTLGQTAVGRVALNGVKGFAEALDLATKPLLAYDELLYGIGEGVCTAQGFGAW